MTQDQEILELRARLDALEGGGLRKCTAENPHDGMMYDRVQYVCRCGQIYLKDGRGGLREG